MKQPLNIDKDVEEIYNDMVKEFESTDFVKIEVVSTMRYFLAFIKACGEKMRSNLSVNYYKEDGWPEISIDFWGYDDLWITTEGYKLHGPMGFYIPCKDGDDIESKAKLCVAKTKEIIKIIQIIDNAVRPGDGHDPAQQTFILMWNPAISSITIHNHIDSIAQFDECDFNWSIYEWEKAHLGDRFFMVRVGEGKTGIVMSGIFSSKPYTDRDWNRVRKNKEVYYIDMQPNFIINPETMPIVTTAQLQEAIPDFEWTRGHSGTLLSGKQAEQLEKLFAKYIAEMRNKTDDENLIIVDGYNVD